MKDYKYAVFIGRFQPLHNGHMEVIRHGLSIADKLIVVVGSTNSAPTVKNPFSFEERKKMIMESVCPVFKETKTTRFGDEESIETITHISEFGNAVDGMSGVNNVILGKEDRVIVVGVRDYHYNYNNWVADVQAKTDQFIKDGDSVALLGDYKDASSYYLKSFPQWDFVPIKNSVKIDATEIREELFSGSSQESGVNGTILYPPSLDNIETKVPEPVRAFLVEYVKHWPFRDMVQEFHNRKQNQDLWSGAPYPVTFVTADSIVVCSGHVLLVKRKFMPGKGLYALPGGFIKQEELIKNAALRELKEETGIKVDKIILESSIVDEHTFDYPGRSLRGRTITHGFYIKLKDGKLPEVRGNDDAERAFWMPLAEVFQNENKFFEDHAHIISYFVNRM